MPGGSPGFFVFSTEWLNADQRCANAHVHVDDDRFPERRDGRATAHARIVDELAKYRRTAPILSTDRGLSFFQEA